MAQMLYAPPRLCALLCALQLASGAMSLSRTLGDSMVLQQKQPAVLWGFAEPGTTVSTKFDGVALPGPATAGPDGVWRQVVPAQPADTDGAVHTFDFSASDGSGASLADVVFGEVVSFGGQSNTSFDVDQAFNSTAEEATADAYSAFLRIMTVKPFSSPTALVDLNATDQAWARVNSSNVGRFSAIGFFYGRGLFEALREATGASVPIGLIANCVGGTAIELWTSTDTLNSCSSEPDVPYAPPYTNGSLYNGMILPFTTGPTKMAAWLFYQAEANAPPYGCSPLWYACAFRGLISGWRSVLQATAADQWFGFVQLAPFIGPDGWEEIRQAQLAGLLEPNVGFASMVDNGDPTSPYGSYHPRNKQLIAERLVRVALAQVYLAEQRRPWRAPSLGAANFSLVGGVATVTASLVDVPPSGVASTPALCPTSDGVNASMCADFSIWFTPAPAPNYTFLGTGFLAAGNDCGHGNWTIAEAAAACTANAVCVGYTFNSNSSDPAARYNVLLKDAVNYLASPGWQSYGSGRDVRGVRVQARGEVLGGDQVVLSAQMPPGASAISGAGYAWSTWPLTPLSAEVDEGLTMPVTPWFAAAP